MRLQRKIQLLVLGLSLTPILLSSLLFFLATRLSRESDEAKAFFEHRRWIEAEVRKPLERGEISDDLASVPEGFVSIADRGGRIVASSHPELIPIGERPPRPAEIERFARSLGDFQVVLEVVSGSGGEEFGMMYARPARTPSFRFADTWRTLGIAAVFGVMLLGGGLSGTFIVRDFQRRLNRLAAATHRIAAGDLASPVQTKSEDEIRDLAEDLDRMRQSILESQQQRNRLLMGVSHDLGTPLTTILGYVEALEDDLFGSEEERKRALRSIRNKAELLQSRIQELIEFVRLETGEWNERRESLPLRKYLTELAEASEADLEVLKRRFCREISLPEEVTVEADRSLLDRVFENLYQNAMRHTGEGDEVRLTARLAEDRSVEIRFEDSGVGFTDMEPEDSFELFRRGTRSRNQSGFGLGLPTCRSILETMGMTIHAERSQLGGAAFVIRAGLGNRDGRDSA